MERGILKRRKLWILTELKIVGNLFGFYSFHRGHGHFVLLRYKPKGHGEVKDTCDAGKQGSVGK